MDSATRGVMDEKICLISVAAAREPQCRESKKVSGEQ